MIEQKITPLIQNPRVRDCDAIRLALIYAITFQNNSSVDLRGVTRLLERRGITPTEAKVTYRKSFIVSIIILSPFQIVSQFVEFCNLRRSTHQTPAHQELSDKMIKAFTKKVIKGFKEVENIYTQHTPELKELIDDLVKGRLKEVQYPFLGSVQQRERPQEVIIFIIGGITYAESLIVHQLNQTSAGVRILAGGSCCLNLTLFLEQVRGAFSTLTALGGDGSFV